MTVVQVMLLWRVHRDHRAGLLPRIRLLLCSDSRADCNPNNQDYRDTHDLNDLPHAPSVEILWTSSKLVTRPDFTT